MHIQDLKLGQKTALGPLSILWEKWSQTQYRQRTYLMTILLQYTQEISNLPDPVNIFTKTIEESLQTIEFTIAIVQEKLSKMKPNKAPGIDNFNSSMLREVSSAIASPLCEIFNGRIEMGQVPLDWKKANVTPIYKNKGTKSQQWNYRLVSLTSHISKTMESIIRDEIIRHLQKMS